MSSMSPSEASRILRALPIGAPVLTVWINGLYTCLVVATLHALCNSKRSDFRPRRSKVWTALVITLYICATIHSTGTIVFVLRVFALHGGDPSVVQAFSNQDRVFRGFFAVMFLLPVLISDLLFIWRCWIIWEKRWAICVVPVLTTVAGTALAILSVVGQVEIAEKRTPGVVPKHFVTFTTPYFILSLATSLYSTVLIAIRVLLVQREVASLGIHSQFKKQYSRVVELVVESTALNSVNLIAFVVLTVRKTGNLDWPQDIQPQIAGIAPTLILLRVALNHARSDSDWSTMCVGSLSGIQFARSFHRGGTTTTTSNAMVNHGANHNDTGLNVQETESEKNAEVLQAPLSSIIEVTRSSMTRNEIDF